MIELNPEKAWIFRITHIENVLWYLENGLHCCNSECLNPDYVEIGNPDLIGKRDKREVPIHPGGKLSDYVPFYFTPHSMMLYNIQTGYNVKMQPKRDIAILVSSLPKVIESKAQFVFTDRHAYVMAAQFSNNLQDLNLIDWDLLRKRNFKRDPDDPGKCERYQAEALVWKVLPVSGLLGIACSGDDQRKRVQEGAERLSLQLKVITRPDWYF